MCGRFIEGGMGITQIMKDQKMLESEDAVVTIHRVDCIGFGRHLDL